MLNLKVFDISGRLISQSSTVEFTAWDGLTSNKTKVKPGRYFLRYRDNKNQIDYTASQIVQ